MRLLLSSIATPIFATASLLFAAVLPLAGQDWNFSHDAGGNTTARSAAVAGAPQIIGQPQPQIVAVGDVATFSVVVADASGTTFQWKFNGGDIGGATSDSLVIPSVVAENAGQYSVVVTRNAVNVTSANTALLLDSDGDQLPDTWELANFGNLDQAATSDTDADGANNRTEYVDGTDPTSDASRKVRLTLAATGGAVTVSPVKASYDLGEVVTLTAIPTPPNSFRQWEGSLTGTLNPQALVMSADRSVTARFSYLPVAQDLIAWWRGETDASESVGGNHGTFYVGGTPGSATTAAGKVAKALQFDGTRHVRVPDASALRPARLTAEAWVYPSVTSASSQTIISRGSSTNGTNAWSLSLINGRARFTTEHMHHGTQVLEYTTTALPLNTWSHLAIVFNGTHKFIYLNGTAVTNVPFGAPLSYDPAVVPLTIGADWVAGASAELFTGRIDELSLYSRALAATEIAAIYNAGAAGKTTAQPLFTTAAILREAVVGTAYSTTLTVADAVAPLAFSVAAGSLPGGLALSEGGVLSGTPLSSGLHEFDALVRDGSGRWNQRRFTLRVVASTAPPQDLISWWRFEPDVSGLAMDHVGGRNGSFFVNAAPGTASYAPGKVGSAFFLPTLGPNVRIPDAPALRPTRYTLEAWVYPTFIDAVYRPIVARGSTSSSNDTWYLGIRNGVIDYFSLHTGNGLHLLNSPAIPVYEWTHVVATFDGSTKALYFNGVQVASVQNLGALVYEGTAPVTIGTDWEITVPSGNFAGLIDEVSLYGRALTATEIADLSAAGAAGKSLNGPFSIDLGSAVVGQPLTQSLSFPTGVAPVTYALLSGTPPPGITLAPNGTFTGTTATSGEFTFTVRATDANSAFIDLLASLRIYHPSDRPAGLVSWWRAENNMQDSIGANHGSNFGTVTYPAGKVGTAFGLNGSSSLVIPDSPSLRPNSFTFETWVKFAAHSPSGVSIFAGKPVGAGTSNSWAFYYQNRLEAAFSPNGASGQFMTFPFSPTIGRWYHVAYVFEAGVAHRLYLDGVRVASQAVSGTVFWDAQPMLIGRDSDNGNPAHFFNGAIDEPAFYNSAATDSEIAAIHAADLAGKAQPNLGDSEDLDGDQLANLLEYGINTSPAAGNGSPAGSAFIDPFGYPRAMISFVRDPRKSDVTLTVESSGDLYDWVTIATSTGGAPFTGIATIQGEVAGDAPRTVTIIDPYYGTTGFLRIRASR